MIDTITPEIFDHLVRLAALELDSSESEYLRKELNNQLRSVQELADIELDPSIASASHGIPFTPSITQGLRSDEWIPNPRPEYILSQAPEVENGYINVPEILHEELE